MQACGEALFNLQARYVNGRLDSMSTQFLIGDPRFDIRPELEVEFRDFHAEEDRVRIEGTTTSFDAIDRFKAQLEDYPRFASITVSEMAKVSSRSGPEMRTWTGVPPAGPFASGRMLV